MRPDIQKKVFEEIQETCSLDKQEICLDEVSKLDYLDMVVKETLRHFAVPFVGRQLVEDLKVDGRENWGGKSFLFTLFN